MLFLKKHFCIEFHFVLLKIGDRVKTEIVLAITFNSLIWKWTVQNNRRYYCSGGKEFLKRSRQLRFLSGNFKMNIWRASGESFGKFLGHDSSTLKCGNRWNLTELYHSLLCCDIFLSFWTQKQTFGVNNLRCIGLPHRPITPNMEFNQASICGDKLSDGHIHFVDSASHSFHISLLLHSVNTISGLWIFEVCLVQTFTGCGYIPLLMPLLCPSSVFPDEFTSCFLPNWSTIVQSSIWFQQRGARSRIEWIS